MQPPARCRDLRFFVTVNGFLDYFDFQEDVDNVVLDLSKSHVWDGSAVAAIDKAVMRLRQRGVAVEVIGLNERSASLLDRLAIHDKPGAELAIHQRESKSRLYDCLVASSIHRTDNRSAASCWRNSGESKLWKHHWLAGPNTLTSRVGLQHSRAVY